MRQRSDVFVIAPCLVLCGCLTSFKHPLGPAEEGFIEKAMLGTWSCTSTDDPTRSSITILDFDQKQYYLEFAEQGKSERGRLRAYATRIEDASFLSARVLGEDKEEWTVLHYGIADDNGLTLRLVDPEPFEDVIDDATAVRERLSSRLHDPDITQDLMECTRSKDGE